jgi:hypothetical protein
MHIILIVLSLLLPSSSYAWYKEGHMLSAAIAYEHLNPKTKEKVDKITETFGLFYPEHGDFITCSTWPDAIRGTSSIFANWHYTNIPYDPEKVLTANDLEWIKIYNKKIDVIVAIQSSQETLKNKKTPLFEQMLMLPFLTHCVADIHNPLHTTSGYSKKYPKGDRGGNLYKLAKHGSLHSLWDSAFGKIPRMNNPPTKEDLKRLHAFKKELIEKYPKESFQEGKELKPYQWALEGHKIAKNFAYTTPEKMPPSRTYLEKGEEIALQRIVLSGYRLANLLNRTL